MQLEAEQTERRKFQAIAEPPKSKFMQSGHYTADVDLTALNVIADVGVSPGVVPMLFVIFARFFGVKIPSRPVTVPGPAGEDGKRTSVRRDLLFIPSKTHCKQLPAIGGELHNIQVNPFPAHTIPPHTTPHHTTPHHTTPHHTIPYHTIPYHGMPCHAMPYHTIPYHTIPYHTIPYHTIPYHIIPYLPGGRMAARRSRRQLLLHS